MHEGLQLECCTDLRGWDARDPQPYCCAICGREITASDVADGNVIFDRGRPDGHASCAQNQ